MRIVVIVLAAAYVCLTYPTLVGIPDLPTPGLDRSWSFLLTYGATHGMQWGRDIDFTFGPLGYLWSGEYLPPARGPQLLFAFAFGAVRLALVLVVARLSKDLFGLIFFPVALALSIHHDSPVIVAVLGLAWATSAGKVLHPGVAAATGALAALGALTKVQFVIEFIILYVAAAAYPAYAARDGRRLGAALIVFAAAANVTFIAAFHADWRIAALELLGCAAAGVAAAAAYAYAERIDPWTDRIALRIPAAAGVALAGLAIASAEPAIRQYAGNSVELLRGYSGAMSVPGPDWITAIAVALGLAFLAILAGVRKDLRGYVIGLALIVFLAFKHGFVRQDLHVYGYFGALGSAAATVFVLSKHGRARVGAAAIAILALVSLQLVGASVGDRPFADSDPTAFPRTITSVRERIANLDADPRTGLAPLRLTQSLTSALRPGRVAVFPWEVDMPFANDLPPAFAPIPQLYTAYTPALDLQDRRWVMNDAAPPNMLYRYIAIDGRYPLAEAPATSVAVWCRYAWAADGLVGGITYSLLVKTPNRCAPPAPLSRGRVAWDEKIVLPAVARGEALVVHIGIRRTLLGTLADLLWRLDPVMVRTSDAYGTREYRIITADAGDGIVLQPFVTGDAEFRSFMSTGLEGHPSSVSFHAPQPALYAPRIDVVIERLVRTPGPADGAAK